MLKKLRLLNLKITQNIRVVVLSRIPDGPFEISEEFQRKC